MTSPNPTLVFFDLETQHSLQEVGGRRNIHRLGLSVAVTYSSDDGTFRRYTEDSVPELIVELQRADQVIGFNLLRFDYVVLSGYTSVQLSRLPTVDMLDHIHRRLGFRVGLDSLTNATLGSSKSADGLQAVRWWKAGEMDKLLAYCEQDVEVTRLLYEFGRRHRYVQFRDRRHRLRQVPVNW
jgi:DEAD/DEAH box helicase domain-containing protein